MKDELVPNLTDSCAASGHRSSQLRRELVGVGSNFKDVVDEGEERREREGRYEDCDETKLDH